MVVAHLRVPYARKETFPGRLSRYVPVDDHTPEIHAAGGDWAETEIDGDQAIVRVRADQAMIDRIVRERGWKMIDPTKVWTPDRTKPINRGGEPAFDSGQRSATKTLAQLARDVPDDAAFALMQRRAERLVAKADRDGYARLTGMTWRDASRLLTYLGRMGYGLNRVSTGTFPTTSVIDDFNRASLGTDWSAAFGYSICAISSNQLIKGAASSTAAYWDTTTFGPDSEAFITGANAPNGANEYAGVHVRVADAGSGTYDGYTAGHYNGTYTLERKDNGSGTAIGSTYAAAFSNGHKMGVEAIGSTIAMYTDTGGGWTSRTSPTDATYGSAGYIGVDIYDPSGGGVALDDFGGGTVAAASTGSLTPPRRSYSGLQMRGSR